MTVQVSLGAVHRWRLCRSLRSVVGPGGWNMPKLEQLDINTDGLHVGSKLWAGDRGWFVVVSMQPGTVFVRPDK